MEQSRAMISSLRGRLPSNWKLVGIVFALLNIKSLPFAWHLRLLYGLLRQILTSLHRLKNHPSSARPLFAPLIVSSWSGPFECDYNLHKSNSTYFSDSDVGRLHLLIATIGKGVDRTRRELEAEDIQLGGKRGGFGVRLGGVSANFRKEIKPFERFEIWTRILCWDEKWLYCVQHFVRPGLKPEKYLLQPGRKTDTPTTNGDIKQSSPIFASIIAKYVFKKGRLTISPERVLRASEILPPRPEDLNSDTNLSSSTSEATTPATPESIDSSLTAVDPLEPNTWDWAAVEKERARGMKIAQVYAQLDGLTDEFRGEGAEVLGVY